MNRKFKKQQIQQFQQHINLHYLSDAQNISGFLTNFRTSSYYEDNEERTAVLCYFEDENGNRFKCFYKYSPYFFVEFEESAEREVRMYLENKLEKVQIELVEKVDLDDQMHLFGKKKSFFKVSFKTISALMNARNPFKAQLERKKRNKKSNQNYYLPQPTNKSTLKDTMDYIIDIREYDVPYHCRVCIDTGLRAGKWFTMDIEGKVITKLQPSKGKQSIPQLKILAFDIETSKAPLKFPDAEVDQIMMISFTTEGSSFLIINLGFCGQAVDNFEYVPKKKPQFRSQVQVFNEQNQKETLLCFAKYIKQYSPTVITSFNGDKFDYPFIQTRCKKNFIDFEKEFGMKSPQAGVGEYIGNFMQHLDCFYWVERDAFLPHGSHGLKAVTKAKLQYEPQQMDPQDMVDQAKNCTERLAQYSVSDAVATYYLYMKHIHGFIFALATIIPMNPDEVLRKGSGTLCENLLMAEAYARQIIFPNKHVDKFQKFYKGHLLDSQTYTGGRVECLRTGVYRADFPTEFVLSPKCFQQLMNNLDQIIRFTVQHETQKTVEDIINYDQVKKQLTQKLMMLRDVQNPQKHQTLPLIYHLDVAAMYPNIILTNRLQPVAIVNDVVCSNCYYNSPENDCKRDLEWEWKGQHFPLNEGQYELRKQTLMQESHLDPSDKQFEKRLYEEVKKYSQKVYSKVHVSATEIRTNTVCMRQNSFYVDTVRAFRDRRYEFKNAVKMQKAYLDKYKQTKQYSKAKDAEMLMVLYESMQLAHKIILNSFYGYVMRKGSRWYSMETAAMVTYIGGKIIEDCKNFIEKRFGKPLQLDTDGIWLVLPQGFPQTTTIKFKDGKSLKLSYPCQILNHHVYDKYANNQYQILNQKGGYDKRKEMTIAFEIDGPYKAMMIPAAKEKQKSGEYLDIQQQSSQLLKKRYAVFNFKNQISEFKGFEMKRRGELRITKIFQEEIFPQYVKGSSLKDCYNHCAQVARKYIEIISKRGAQLEVSEILNYLQQSRVLSRDVQDYGKSKGVAITSARRLADFLGPDVIKGKRICCQYVISATPVDSPVTDRAIPTLIFDVDVEIQKKYLYKWTKLDSLKEEGQIDIRNILDWDYYMDRLSNQVQKMICIPAVMQNIPNPIPEIQLPEWLQKKTYDMRRHKQQTISNFVLKKNKDEITDNLVNVINNAVIEKKTPLKDIRDKEKEGPKIGLNPYNMMTQFPLWLTEQKKLWKQRKIGKQSNEGNGKWSDTKSVLQIIGNESSGNFTVWYYSGGKINQLLLRVNRKYYCKGTGGKTKKAPREDGVAFEIQIDEEQFIKQQDYDEVIGKKFYETKIPLLTSLIIQKGNLWKMEHKASYCQSDIQQIFGQEYLPGLSNKFLPTVYLVRAQVLQNRIIWVLMNPQQDDYHFIYVDKAVISSTQQLCKLARKVLQNQQAKIFVQHFNQQSQSANYINKYLENYLKKGKYLVVLQSDKQALVLQKMGVGVLEYGVPTLKLSDIKFDGIQLLEWKQKSLKLVIKQCQSAYNQIESLVSWSRYSHVPLCNLSVPDKLDFISNVTFARLLHSGDHITWWNQYNEQLITTYESQFYNGRIINPGLYKSYCFEIDMQNLAVNAIANADQLVTLDRQAASMMINKTQKQGSQRIEHLDEMSIVKVAFEYLKKMVKGWVKDTENQSEEANSLLTNVHKWVTSQSNSMFEPLIVRMVNELMKKVFYRLMNKLKKLGLNVIFGNFSKIIVASEKYTHHQAQSRIDYILKKCVQEDQKIFQYIRLTPFNHFYRVLLFKDSHNFAGIMETNHYFKFRIAELMSKEVGRYLQWLIIYFLKNICSIANRIINQFSHSPIDLHKNYQNLMVERMNEFISTQFQNKVLGLVNQLMWNWTKLRSQYRAQKQKQPQDKADQSQEQQNDSFIDDGDEQAPQQNQTINQDPKDIQKWIKDNQIDMLIENLYYLLCYDDTYKERLLEVRRIALQQVNLKPSLDYRRIQPKYPRFQLPCSFCFHVNQNPGPCEHCFEQSNVSLQLENNVWKMIQQQGRDLYCSLCRKIKQDYLKKCNCGGKWIFKQLPLQWLPYTNRQSKQWNYVNQVLMFMGLDHQQPKYPHSSFKPEIML